MSHQAVSWALKQPVNHSPAKFVLVVLAHHVSASKRPWTAFASITLLAQQTGQDRKTVIANLKRLVDLGFWLTLANAQAPPNRLSCTAWPSPKAVPKLGHLSSPKTGTP